MKKYFPLALFGLVLIIIVAFLPARDDFDPARFSLAIPNEQTEITYTSPVLTRPVFNALFVKYATNGAGSAEFWARFDESKSKDVEADSGWELVHFDDELELGPASAPGTHSGFALTAPTRTFQFRVKLRGTPSFTFSGLSLETSDTRSESSGLSFVSRLLPTALAQISDLKIISRNEWKADPNFLLFRPTPPPPSGTEPTPPSAAELARVAKCNALVAKYPQEFRTDDRTISKNNGGEKLQWPKTYSQKISKIIVHHTDSESVTSERDLTGDGKYDAQDAMATVRAIYRFHAITRGWGDVGYNYLVDAFGNVYEGRDGGERVVAAHTYCANTGTIGVAFVGDFQDHLPTSATLSAGAALLGELANTYELDPVTSVFWHDKETPGVVGHRDYGASACPGEKFYAYLPKLRSDAVAYASAHKYSNTDFAGQIINHAEKITLAPLETRVLNLTLKNTGRSVWSAGTQIKSTLVNRAQNSQVLTINRDADLVATLGEVLPREATREITLPITAKLQAGTYFVVLVPSANGKKGESMRLEITITAPTLNYEVVKAKHPPRPFAPEAKATAWIELRNKSNFTWRATGESQTYLGTTNPLRRASVFVNGGTELGTLEADTPPGAVGHFTMNFTAPEKAGIYKESFAPAIRNFGYLPDYKMGFDITVREPKFEVAVVNQSGGAETTFGPGETKTLALTLKNTSQLEWNPEQFEFVPFQSTSFAYDAKQIQLSASVAKNVTTDLKFSATAPTTPGIYTLAFQPKWHNGKIKLADPIRFTLTVAPANLTGTLLDVPTPFTLARDEVRQITIAYKNTGNVTWNKKDLVLQRLPAEPSALADPSWISLLQPAKLTEESVVPGAVGHFTFIVRSSGGRIREEFVPIVRGLGRVRGAAARVEISNNSQTTTQPTTNDRRPTTDDPRPTTMQNSISQTMQNATFGPTLRIRLGFVSERVEIGGGALTLHDASGKQIFSGSFVDFEKARFRDGEFFRIVPSGTTILTITNWKHTPGWSETVNDNKYRGILEVRRIGDELKVINELPLEDYLRGVAEPLPTDPPEKVKLLAILARSYALYYADPAHRKYPGQPYDGSDNPAEFQKYLGQNYEARGNMPGAVEDTRGLVVTYAGKVVKTPYFTSSGGRTRTIAEAKWSATEFPFIKSVSDPWSCGLNSSALGTNFSCPENARGHGVGVSGTGATGLAREGKTYLDIINYFYTGVKVERKY